MSFLSFFKNRYLTYLTSTEAHFIQLICKDAFHPPGPALSLEDLLAAPLKDVELAPILGEGHLVDLGDVVVEEVVGGLDHLVTQLTPTQ